jgi:glycosyltransferase involved in cell wall biosynthesis
VHPRKRHFESELRRRVEERGLGGAVTLLGHRSDLREIMAVSDVVLSLSKEPESFGRTTLEALALGRPVAGYSHGGVREQLEAVFPDGQVPVGDVDALEALLLRWHAEPPRVADCNPFTLERMQRATLDVYEELVDGRRR